MIINSQRFFALLRKEIIQLLRDKRLLLFILGMPILQLVFYGYAASLTVFHLPLGVFDQSNDANSRLFIQQLTNSQFFDLTELFHSREEVVSAINREEVKIGLIIPPHFSANLLKGNANILFLLDGTDNTSVQSGYSAAVLISRNFSNRLRVQGLSLDDSYQLPISTYSQILYNPNLVDIWFILPGLVGLILQTMAITQAVFSLVRDRESGTIEPILVTPVRPLEILLSKVISLSFLCLVTLLMVLGIGIYWFKVQFSGNFGLYFLLAFIFIFSSLGLGLVLSTRAKSQMEATQYGMTFMMIGILMSGFMYPTQSMPIPLQIIGSLFPVTYFIRLSRGIFLKGVGISFIWIDALVLFLYSIVIILLVLRSYRTRLD